MKQILRHVLSPAARPVHDKYWTQTVMHQVHAACMLDAFARRFQSRRPHRPAKGECNKDGMNTSLDSSFIDQYPLQAIRFSHFSQNTRTLFDKSNLTSCNALLAIAGVSDHYCSGAITGLHVRHKERW